MNMTIRPDFRSPRWQVALSVGCLLLTGCLTASSAQVVSESRAWTDTFPVSTKVAQLEIINVWGDIEVSRGKPGQIVVSVKELRSAPDQRLFDHSLEVLNLKTLPTDKGLKLVVGQEWGSWRQHQSCRNCRAEYQFKVQVPPASDIEVSTVNDGEINIAGIVGEISASNVNGPIFVSGAQHCQSFSNVNGVVDIGFSRSPTNDCEIETINGDINLTLPSSAGLNLALDQTNGKISSEFPIDSLSLPAKVEHIKQDGINRYRIQQAAGLRLAGGGQTFTISSLNGDVRIKTTSTQTTK